MKGWKTLALAVAAKAAQEGPQVPLEDGFIEENWPGHDDNRQTCGSHANHLLEIVNRTCTITGLENVRRFFLGQGAFIAPYAGDDSYTFYGLDGVTGDELDAVVFWDQTFDELGFLQNGTCGTAAEITAKTTCVDNAGFPDGAYFMENINDHRHQSGEGQNYNFQVAGIGNKKWGHNGLHYVVSIKDHAGDAYPMTNITGIHLTFDVNDGLGGDGGHLEMDEWGNWHTNTGVFSFTATDQHNSQLVHFFGTRVENHPTEPDMWMSTVLQS